MEKTLKKLFDFNRFENNARLNELISETEDRYARELSDFDLGFVNAAGNAEIIGEERSKHNEN